MNKKFFWTSITLLALTLTACASSTGTPASAPSSGPDAAELPVQTKLVLGTINLEETDYPVPSEQAAELLPMFYVLQDLNDSDTAAQEEIDGLVAQIQETLTAEQTQAIDGMSLSMRDVFAISQGSSGNTSSSDAESATSAGGPPDMGAGDRLTWAECPAVGCNPQARHPQAVTPAPRPSWIPAPRLRCLMP
ncbi:MAG: hypothetical protein IPL71_05190 [Anaerolineales bacterium]|uniref:hypothetical protein n=1 Tax=Candidatus Villigracilis proximus TaxID=3140683 RepID=UPI003134B233|nr:hypothetical protein [Anaerolineales bacterium]